jgi:hypothetical protein
MMHPVGSSVWHPPRTSTNQKKQVLLFFLLASATATKLPTFASIQVEDPVTLRCSYPLHVVKKKAATNALLLVLFFCDKARAATA